MYIHVMDLNFLIPYFFIWNDSASYGCQTQETVYPLHLSMYCTCCTVFNNDGLYEFPMQARLLEEKFYGTS